MMKSLKKKRRAGHAAKSRVTSQSSDIKKGLGLFPGTERNGTQD